MESNTPTINDSVERVRQKQDRATEQKAEIFRQDYLLPYDAELERGLLGLMLIDERMVLNAISTVSPTDFHVAPYRHCYEAMQHLCQRGDTVDAVQVASVLRERGFLEKIGGVPGILNLSWGMISSRALLSEYSNKLRNLAIKRQVFELSAMLARETFNPTKSSEELLNYADSALSHLRAHTSSIQTLKSYSDVAKETQFEIDLWREGKSRAIPTGIPELDRKLWARGLAQTELYFIAALTSLGKTALVLQIINNIEMRGLRGVMFSMEMAGIKLLLRAVQRMSSGLEVSPYTMLEIKDPHGEKQQHRKQYSDYAYQRAKEILVKISSWNGLIDDKTRNWNSIKAKIRQAHSDQPLDYIAADYIQICKIVLESRSARRDQEVARISAESKELAMELDVPFIWISQFNRDAKPGVRPEPGDLKESSQIEQDADFLGFIYGKGAGKDKKRETQLYCPKQRNGPAGWEISMEFAADRQMFLTGELTQMLNSSEPTQDEVFLREFKARNEPQQALAPATTSAPVRDADIDF